MEIKDLITLTGIAVSLIVGFAGLYVSIKNSKKTLFINTITSLRAKWIDTLRNSVTDFVGCPFQIFQSTPEEKIKKNEKIRTVEIFD